VDDVLLPPHAARPRDNLLTDGLPAADADERLTVRQRFGIPPDTARQLRVSLTVSSRQQSAYDSQRAADAAGVVF